jgi:hypothetical protein
MTAKSWLYAKASKSIVTSVQATTLKYFAAYALYRYVTYLLDSV